MAKEIKSSKTKQKKAPAKKIHSKTIKAKRPAKSFPKPISLALRYLRGVKREFKNVVWPKRSLAIKLTAAVIVYSVIVAGIVALFDYGVGELFEKLINRSA